MSGNLFLSITYQDEIVDFQENVVFSARLNELGINHTLFLYNGTHRDPFPGIIRFSQLLIFFFFILFSTLLFFSLAVSRFILIDVGIVQCFKTFEKRLCAAPAPPPTTTTIPVWLFWTGVGMKFVDVVFLFRISIFNLVALVILETVVIIGFVGKYLYTRYHNNGGYEEIPF
jgi:hypothetical protein